MQDTAAPGQLVQIGRQAIFDRKLQLHAYELLFRAGPGQTGAHFPDGKLATAHTILEGVLTVGLDRLVGPHPVFINLTREYFVDLPPLPLAPQRVVFEVLEDIPVDEALIAGVANLHRRGHRIALDDFRFEERWQPLLPFASIIKVDITGLDPADLAARLPALRRRRVQLLAEKVETRDQHARLHALGFDLFQGYFFARPQIVEGKRLDANALVVLELIRRVNDPEVTVDQLCGIIGSDPALAFKILRAVNAAEHNLERRLSSVREAVVYLGLNRIRAWATLFALAHLDRKPSELLTMGLVRANVCERLARRSGRRGTDVAYTVGLLSVLDAMFDRPMREILAELPLPPAIHEAITSFAGPDGCLLKHAIDLERGRPIVENCTQLGQIDLVEVYLESSQAASALLGDA